VIVVDTSALIAALMDDGRDGDVARAELGGQALAAPELIDVEALSVIRRLSSVGQITLRRAERAIEDLTDLPLRRVPHRALLPRCWELRNDLTPYDAAYVALAEMLACRLLTADRRIARSPGLRCAVRLVG
jgi:predicted nucleic acid-binding protein